MPPPAVTVWFDGDCPLCVREIALMRRLDRRGAIAFVDLAGGGGCPADRAALLERFHAQESGGEMVSGAAAFAALWRAIPVLAPFGRMARNPVLLWGLERAYRGFLRIRPRLQALARRFSKIPPGERA
ncbi:thiol-disulfide oxidoreductase DCC family protein [Caulobacter sp. DWR1-3-2b1]|uniref:thiol-disulfide oxidoreductase DCC family protein n=1 Tax=Caulobacter sp. DWR1-3-2b1 TaxID=2804670 RepID=UPI003CEF897D